jgi:hypothetical protein
MHLKSIVNSLENVMNNGNKNMYQIFSDNIKESNLKKMYYGWSSWV